ncbi:MAG: ergothioneine biosynthesis protein EgtB [Acidobacteria bacterium]|nr:ergothioneine biosynthesis protein EgtB [Acidobacteriota bacterium]
MQPAKSIESEPESLTAFYLRVRAHTESLCEPLEIEDYIPQPVVDVSPPKWNIAHTTWFFEEMILKRFVPDYKVFDTDFGFLFNSYYNSIGDRTPRDHRSLSRPTVKRVFEYRKYVDERMVALLAEPPALAGGRDSTNGGVDLLSDALPPADAGGSALADLVVLGLNHEQQHQELFLTDLKYTLGLNPLFPVYRADHYPEEIDETRSSGFAGVGEGIYEIGHTGDSFCFDNELARHKVFLGNFEIATKLVTNFEFLEFINDHSYRDHRLWHSEGWDWVSQNAVDSPLHWHKIDGEWHQYTLGGLRKLNLDAPVCHVSYYEASAFAEWRGMRLPTEFEWEAANDKFGWGIRWEWTNSAYLPYPGFEKVDGAVGEYNGKFMINQMVLRGASVATPDGHSRSTYRNFFHPHLRWQFTGIRLVR